MRQLSALPRRSRREQSLVSQGNAIRLPKSCRPQQPARVVWRRGHSLSSAELTALAECGRGLLLRRPRLPGQPRLQHRGVGDEPFDDVQSEQCLDRRPQRFAATRVLGQRPNLLAVEKEELRNLQRDQFFDQLRPVGRERVAEHVVLEDAEALAELAVLDLPGTPPRSGAPVPRSAWRKNRAMPAPSARDSPDGPTRSRKSS